MIGNPKRRILINDYDQKIEAFKTSKGVPRGTPDVNTSIFVCLAKVNILDGFKALEYQQQGINNPVTIEMNWVEDLPSYFVWNNHKIVTTSFVDPDNHMKRRVVILGNYMLSETVVIPDPAPPLELSITRRFKTLLDKVWIDLALGRNVTKIEFPDDINNPTDGTFSEGGDTYLLDKGFISTAHTISDGIDDFIDTGVSMTDEIRIVATMNYNSLNDGKWLFGALDNGASSRFGCRLASGNYQFFGGDSSGKNIANPDLEKHTIDLSKSDLIFDGVNKGSFTGSYVGSSNMYIYAANEGGDISHANSSIFNFKIYKSGVLVRNFIPQNNGSMLDIVNDIYYYNKGLLSNIEPLGVGIEFAPNDNEGNPTIPILEGDIFVPGTEGLKLNASPTRIELYPPMQLDEEYAFFDTSNILIWKSAFDWDSFVMTQQFIDDNIQDDYKNKFYIKVKDGIIEDAFFYTVALDAADDIKAREYINL